MKYKITIDTETPIDYITGKLKIHGKILNVENIKEAKLRTELQNRSLHKYYSLLAEALNDGGFEMQKVIRQSVEIPWTGTTVKEILWRPLQKAYKLEHSTTRLKTTDIDKIYDLLNKTIGERTGIYVPWPCMDNMLIEDYEPNK